MTGTAMFSEPRHHCRRCRAKLATPTSNERSAFCSKGCHRYWYDRHCMACEGPMTDRHGRKCRIELAAIKRHGMMGKFYQKRQTPTKIAQRAEALSQTPIFKGPAVECFSPEGWA
jgi:hypothetical protein